MRLFKYELYKIITRKLFWGMLIAALFVNILALWFLNHPDRSNSYLSHAEVKAVYDTLRVLPFEEKLAWLANEHELMNAHQNKDSFRSMMMWRQDSRGGKGFGDDEYINELEAQYLEARERFGERLDEDLPWYVIQEWKSLFASIVNDLTTNTYSAYLGRIDDEAAVLLGSAIFGGDPETFSYRNIEMTQNDFRHMRGTEIRYDVNNGIKILFDSPSSDVIILMLIVVICIVLITDEKDKRLFLIVKSTPKGHIHTIFAKLGALSVAVAFVNALIFLTTVVFAEHTFGLGDVMRSIQSVPMFFGSTLQLTVSGFMGLYLLVKTAAFICIGMGVMLIAIHARHSIILILTTLIAAALNVLLSAIPVISSWNVLRFLNLYSLIRPHIIFGNYFNLNMFEHPVRLAPVFIGFALMVFAALLTAVILSYLKKQGLESNLDLFKFKRLRLPARVHKGYKFYEFKKLAFNNKAALILAGFMLIQGYNVYNMREPFLGFEHHHIKNAMLSLEGPLTKEKHEFIQGEKARLDNAQSEIDRLNQELMMGEMDYWTFWELARAHYETMNNMWGFHDIYERYEYVRDTRHAEFLYETGYVRLFGLRNPNIGLNAGMWLIGVMILCLSGIFPMEYKTGMYKILNASPHGHGATVRLKILLCFGAAFIAFVIAELPEFIYIGRYFGFAGLGAPLASIPPAEAAAFPAFMGDVPIAVYLSVVMFVRLFVFTGLMFIILALSLKVRNNAYAIMVSAGVLLVPLIMYRLGLPFFRHFSIMDLMSVNNLIITPSPVKLIQSAVFMYAAGFSVWYVVKKFGRT